MAVAAGVLALADPGVAGVRRPGGARAARRGHRDRAGAGAAGPARRSPSAGPPTWSTRPSRCPGPGFRPSSATRLQNSGDSLDVNTENPVRVYQCRGDRPGELERLLRLARASAASRRPTPPRPSPAVPPFTYPGQTDPFDATPDGPANWQDNVTRADGTGQVTIQVFTKRESAGLGCDADGPVLDRRGAQLRPAAGRHRGPDGRARGRGPAAPSSRSRSSGGRRLPAVGRRRCASRAARWPPTCWRRWRGSTCTLANDAVTLDYTAIGEPQTRGDVASGTTDVGLVIDPLDADARRAGRRRLRAGQRDRPGGRLPDRRRRTGRPVTSMRLNARLVAKLITASYRSGGDPAVINNPANLFRDPEFLELNPGGRLAERRAGQPPAAARRPLRHHRRR